MRQDYVGRYELRKRQRFDKHLAQLKTFLKKFGRYPDTIDNSELCTWVSAIRHKNKRQLLPQEYVEKLNSIGFIWDKQAFNWYEKAKETRRLLEEEQQVPTYNQHLPIYQWLKTQLELFSRRELKGDQKRIIKEIKVLISHIPKVTAPPKISITVSELKWAEKFYDLVEYRKRNPTTWPQEAATDEQESRLGIWCRYLRSRYNKELLDDFWRDKLLSIGFTFPGRLGNWKNRFDELQTFILTRHKVPGSYSDLYTWSRLQHKNFKKLSAEKRQLLNAISFLQYFKKKTWKSRYEEVRAFVLRYKKRPTRQSNQELSDWLSMQRTKYRKNKLNGTKIRALRKIGIDLELAKTREKLWLSKYEEVKQFREEHPHRWPGAFRDSSEKVLYLWCQAQRQVRAGSASNRKPLSKERINKLEQIGFRWSGTDRFKEK